jgi:hypothetical protein
VKTAAYDYDRRAATTPLPSSFPASEIGLMTKEELLTFRNPGDKSHPSDAYDVSLMRLNEDHGPMIGHVGHGSDQIDVQKRHAGYELTMEGKLVAVVHAGTAYYDNPRLKKRIPRNVPTFRMDESVDLGIEKFRHVKYLSEVVPLISPIAKMNEQEFPVILQRIKVKGESMAVRAEKQPALDKGVSIVILNSRGLRVAMASDEWGATLFRVVQEYRGFGLGKILGKYWYEYNPNWQSGGFTQAGQANDLSIWRDRVREFVSNGWYSQLIREGRLTQERLKAILKGVGKRPAAPKEVVDTSVKPTGKILFYADDVTFVLYDRAFLDEPDEKFIHGFGFLRDNHLGTFLYRIEYDRPFAKLVTEVALQMAKDNGDRLYDAGDGVADLLEDVDSIPGVVRDGDYLEVTQNLVPLKMLSQQERRTRKPLDPYGEKYNQLLEMAESKW